MDNQDKSLESPVLANEVEDENQVGQEENDDDAREVNHEIKDEEERDNVASEEKEIDEGNDDNNGDFGDEGKE